MTAQVVATGKRAAAGRTNKRLLAAVRGQFVFVQVAGLEEAFAARVADGAALVRMRPGNSGLAIKKPTQKKPPKKTYLKKPTINVFLFFWGFLKFFLFFMKIIQTFLFETDFL